MIDLHKEDEKLFALVGACQRDVLLRSSPLEKLLQLFHTISSLYTYRGIGCQEEFFKIRKTKRTSDEASFFCSCRKFSFHLIFLFLFHICKPLHSLRKLCNRLIRISVLDAVAHAVLDMALEDNLSYFMKCRFCRLDLRQDILARHILIHPYGRSPALDR